MGSVSDTNTKINRIRPQQRRILDVVKFLLSQKLRQKLLNNR